MKRIVLPLAAGLVALAVGSAASAQSWSDPGRFSIGLGVGTNGGVGEVAYEIDPHFVLRAQAAGLDFNHHFTSRDVAYNGEAVLITGGLSLDFHPFANAFLISGGFVSGERRVDLRARPSGSAFVLGGVTYPSTDITSVRGHMDYGSTAPVAAIGFDNTYVGQHHWGVRALLGVQFGAHPPSVALHANGPLAADPVVVSQLQAERTTLAHDGADFSYYPVAQVGVTYRF